MTDLSKTRGALIIVLLAIVALGAFVAWRFQADLEHARARIARGSTIVATPCGQIEYQEAGAGAPLLAIHGSGGGYDQGMAFAAPLARQGIRVIAMSRFGYLRTPMPKDASAQAQADAHVCLLDALGIDKAAVLGGSAGAPSALQMAIGHPDRVTALILVAPLAYKPPTQADSAAPMAPWAENTMMAVIGSDFLFWAAARVARGEMIKTVLATPPALLAKASASERARINAMLDDILPVSARAAGLRSDSVVGKTLRPARLQLVRSPTLIIAARDDRYGTYASAEFTARQIAGARFIGFATGGHTWIGRNDEVMSAITALLIPSHEAVAPE
ncbi:MAG: alpha/beta fold hydrolase [Caulobacterales bacterium]